MSILLYPVIIKRKGGRKKHMSKVCAFGKEIKKKLVDIDQTQDWLICEVGKDTGKYFDSGYLHRILRGEIATPSICASICKILGLEDPAGEEEKPA